MCARFCCKMGSVLAFAALTMPAMADQIPSAIVPEGAYHLSPHKPVMENETGDAGGEVLQQPTINERQTDYAIMPHKSAIVENPLNSISPHKPSIDEMPSTTPPRQTVPDSQLVVSPNHMQQPEPAQQQTSPQAQPTQRVTPAIAPVTMPQNQSGTETDHPQARKKQQDNGHNRHFSKPYSANMPLSPMLGLGAACINSSVTICGKIMPVAAGPIGAVTNLTAPFPYLPQTFTVQCLAVNGVPAYRIVDATQVTCELQSCVPADVNICGAAVNVPASVKVGKRLKVPIPPSVLSSSATAYNMALRVRCGEGPNSTAAYHIENEAEISCNQFPCQTSTVRFCGATIEVPGGSPLGSVLTLTMPPPFVPDQFVVQCLGTMGRQPAYQIIEHENVGCARMEGQ